MIEPVQGEGGVNPATPEFMRGLREFCDEQEMLLLLDQVQTGWCRTGNVMAYMGYGVTPDIVSMAKAMGGGMPISAICAKENVAKAFSTGSHGTTYGGNPVCCAASLAQVHELIDGNYKDKAAEMGEYFAGLLEQLPHALEVRGQGLLIGVEFDLPIAVEVKHHCLENHLLITALDSATIRMVPPLIVSKEECDQAFAIILAAVEESVAEIESV